MLRSPLPRLPRPRPSERFGVRVTAAAGALVLFAVPFSLLALLVAGGWAPVIHADRAVESHLHSVALRSGWMVRLAWGFTFFGNTATRLAIVAAAVAVLLTRRAWRLAGFLAATGGLGGVLDTVIKHIVNRARPVLPDPITSAHGTSFPSGHAMGAMVVYGALLLVLLPALPAVARGWAKLLTAALVLAVGISRVVLGVHFPTDVIAGWLIGLTWLVCSAALFNLWRAERGERKARPVAEGVEPEAGERLRSGG